MLSRSSLFALAAGYASAAFPADLVTNLPGFGAPLSKLYSGYLNAGTGKYLHYVYSESLNNPSTDPLVIWVSFLSLCYINMNVSKLTVLKF